MTGLMGGCSPLLLVRLCYYKGIGGFVNDKKSFDKLRIFILSYIEG